MGPPAPPGGCRPPGASGAGGGLDTADDVDGALFFSFDEDPGAGFLLDRSTFDRTLASEGGDLLVIRRGVVEVTVSPPEG